MNTAPIRFMMRKFLLTMTMLLCSMVMVSKTQEVEAEAKTPHVEKVSKISSKNSNWDKLIKAIIHVESKGNPNAKGGSSVGILQITPVCVSQCNIILKRQGKNKKFTLADRKDRNKSIEMFNIIQNEYNPEHLIEKAIRMWNGGPNYSVRKTERYYQRVMNEYRSVK
jgi:hypothetical protein